MKVVLTHPDAKTPAAQTEQAAGYDLYTPIAGKIGPRDRAKIPLGIRIKLDRGTFGQIHCRSSLGAKGIAVLGGVIDSDYRGEVIVMLINHAATPFEFNKGDRIAQLIIHKIEETADPVVVEQFPEDFVEIPEQVNPVVTTEKALSEVPEIIPEVPEVPEVPEIVVSEVPEQKKEKGRKKRGAGGFGSTGN